MPDALRMENRVARKEHVCNYCGEKIMVGETYSYSRLKCDDWIYDWKSHLTCEAIASRLCGDCDDNGVTQEYFNKECWEFCRERVCKSCKDWSKFYDDCEKEKNFCTDKIYETLFKNRKQRKEEMA